MSGAVLTFDTLSAARRLREKGMPQEQAEAVADEMRLASQLDVSHLSTKEEMAVFKSELKADLKALELSNKADISGVNSEIVVLRRDIEILRRDLTIRLGGMIMALGGVLIAVKYLG